MKLEKWREGINLCIDNIEQLIKDGELLLKHKSYGHAYFSFYTAMEEISIADFIMQRSYCPEPAKLKKFLEHIKKAPLAISKLYKSEINNKSKRRRGYTSLSPIRIGSERSLESDDYKEGLKLSQKKNLWTWRNRGIYISLSKDNSKFYTPKDIPISLITEIHQKVSDELELLKEKRDKLFVSFKVYKIDPKDLLLEE